MKKIKNKRRQLILISAIIILLFYIITISYSSKNHLKDNLPVMNIELNNETTLEQINSNDKKIKYDNNKMTIDNKEYTITIKGRGHYSWKFVKKPYQITFDDKTSLLDLPKTKKYVLLANYDDPSLLKNDFTFKVAKKMNLNYSQTGTFINLYIDKKYLGTYYIIPKVGINKASVDLKDDNAIMMELDNVYFSEEDNYYITEHLKDHLTIKDSQNEDYQVALKAFLTKYNLMEKNILDKNYEWLKENVDLDSIVKFYIISGFANNPDSIRSSIYFYMDGTNDKIHLGHIWDFDAAYGLILTKPDGEILPSSFREKTSTVLFDKLLEIDEFNNQVSNYWKKEACNIYKEEIDKIDNTEEYLKDSGEMNSMYWNNKHYKSHTNDFKKWVNERYKYFNNKYGCDNNE